MHNFWHKRGFFCKFYLSDFYLLIVAYHATKFEKILTAVPEKFYKVEKFTKPHTHKLRTVSFST